MQLLSILGAFHPVRLQRCAIVNQGRSSLDGSPELLRNNRFDGYLGMGPQGLINGGPRPGGVMMANVESAGS